MEIFIGSSKESVSIAHDIACFLEEDGVCAKVWDERLFVPSTFTLENLERIAKDFDAAIFVFSPDDKLWYRGEEYSTVRDNVLFETGLFIGKLSKSNVCICTSGSIKTLSDLLGFVTINCDRGENNLRSDLKLWLDNLKTSSDIKMHSKSYVDNHPSLEERWKFAREVVLVNYAATSFLSSNLIASESVYSHKIQELFERKLREGTNFKFLLTTPGSYADYDAAKYKMCVTANSDVKPQDAITIAAKTIKEKAKKYKAGKGNIEYKFTDIALPYGAMLVINDEYHSFMDHIRIDIYSPLLQNDRNRRSFMIYVSNKDNYDFFFDNISKMWIEAHEITSYKHHIIKNIRSHKYDNFNCGNLECTIKTFDEDNNLENLLDIYCSCYFMVISGEVEFILKNGKDSSRTVLKSGDSIIIPRQVYYSLKICCRTQLLKIVCKY